MTDIDSRTAILARLRAAQRTALLPEMPATPRQLTPATAGPVESLARFRRELEALGVESHLEDGPGAVQERVRSLLAGKRVLSWDAERLPYDLGTVLRELPVTYGRDPREQQAQAEIGLTGCDAAVAETGTLALFSGPGKARTVSLLPPAYLAVVRREDLLFSMGELFERHREAMAGSANCTLVTGPSRTADIELTLTLGVHGPGKVTVVIGP
jgi:L-lactate dehydrogenase complex protein LldG